MDIVSKIIEYEIEYKEGTMGALETLEFFAELINTGLVWKLQGSYGRMAHFLLTQTPVEQDTPPLVADESGQIVVAEWARKELACD